jgi:hypothetical protein
MTTDESKEALMRRRGQRLLAARTEEEIRYLANYSRGTPFSTYANLVMWLMALIALWYALTFHYNIDVLSYLIQQDHDEDDHDHSHSS